MSNIIESTNGSALFFIFYSRREQIQRRNDPNRISNIKTAMELEDCEFIEMVEDLKLDYDDTDLGELEQELSTKMQRA